jgi:hypothetical protein
MKCLLYYYNQIYFYLEYIFCCQKQDYDKYSDDEEDYKEDKKYFKLQEPEYQLEITHDDDLFKDTSDDDFSIIDSEELV